MDKKPGSLESASEALTRHDVDDFANDLADEHDLSQKLRREDTEIEKVPVEGSEAPTQEQRTMNMSILINTEPMTHDYADVDQPQKQSKAKNFKRTFVDQSNFSYFNTVMDEDMAQKKLHKRRQTHRHEAELQKRQLVLQNGDVIEEDPDDEDDITESLASEVAGPESSPLMRMSEVRSTSNVCQAIVYDLVDLVVETMVAEESRQDRQRSSAVVARSDMSERDVSKMGEVSPLKRPDDPNDRKTSEQAVAQKNYFQDKKEDRFFSTDQPLNQNVMNIKKNMVLNQRL